MADEALDVQSIFREARGLGDPQERGAYVHRACRGAEALESILCDLLEISDTVGAATLPMPPQSDPPGDPAGSRAGPEQPGQWVGKYRLLKPIGEGGFGTVYLAEQREPVRRNVALKIIRPGMDTRQVIARFELERQALALMEHPNIARVLDAGATEAGRPYFVMELVAGEPITEYCDHHGMTIRDRLELFGQVCGAVQHAHTKGIIHRDLKPGNVLVSTHEDRPFARIIDFGIAKSAYAALATDRTLVTENRQVLGTPVYMSPEQAEGSADIDTRTDIYSLGALLYELLTGSTPFSLEELQSAGIAELHRIIREVEPPDPSRRISLSASMLPTIAARRAIDPQGLRSAVRGELDWIVMKCLEKDRTRRYESAGSLAADLGRHLRGDTVLAAPASTTYRLGKFVRRHRVWVGSVAVAAVALVAGLGAALAGLGSAVRARDAERVARREAESALQFVSEMFGAVDPRFARGPDAKVAEILDPAAETVGRAFRDDAEGEARVRGVLGRAYSNLARYPEARREFDRAWQLRSRLGPADDPQSLALLHEWGATLLAAGEVAQGRDLLRRAWEGRSARLGPRHRDALATRSLLAYARQLDGDLEGATAEIREVVKDQESTLGPDDRGTLESLCSLADMLESAGKFDEALRVAHEAAARAAAAQGPDGDLALMASSIEAEVLGNLSREQEGVTVLERVVRGKENRYGPGHPETLVSLDVLAGMLRSVGQEDRAIAIGREVVDRSTTTLGERHASTLTYMNNLAQALRHAGRLPEAEALYRRVIALRRETEGPEAEGTLVAVSNLGLLLMQRGTPGAALPLLEEAVRGFESGLPSDHWMLGVALMNLGKCQAALGNFRAAEANLLDARRRLRQALGPSHRRTEQAAAALADLRRVRSAAGRGDR